MAGVALKTPSDYVVKAIEKDVKAIQKIEKKIADLTEKAKQQRRDAIGQAVYALMDEWPGARGPVRDPAGYQFGVPWCWACSQNEFGRVYIATLGGRTIAEACVCALLVSNDPAQYDCVGTVADMTIYLLRAPVEED